MPTHISCPLQSLSVKYQITLVTQPLYSPDFAPCNFWLFPKLKSPLKGKRFQTVDEIQENMTGQLMVTRRTVWSPKVPTLKGTEVSLSCAQCFLYLGSSSINVSIFHITWLDTFWTILIFHYILIFFKWYSNFLDESYPPPREILHVQCSTKTGRWFK